MNNLKPCGHDTQLIYKCPGCGFKHWKLVSEVTRPHPAIHCHCGLVTDIEQVTDLKIKAKYGDDKSKKQNSVTLHLQQNDVDKARGLIVSQGFSQGEAKTLITRAISFHNREIESTADLVKFAIAEAESVYGTKTN